MAKHWHIITTESGPGAVQTVQRTDISRERAQSIAGSNRVILFRAGKRGVVSVSECWLTDAGHGGMGHNG